MPELPEVETVVRGLQASVVGRRVLSLRLGKTDFIDDPPAIESLVPGTGLPRSGDMENFWCSNFILPLQRKSITIF